MGLWHNLKVRLGLEDDWDDEYYEDDATYAEGPAEEEAYAPLRRRLGAKRLPTSRPTVPARDLARSSVWTADPTSTGLAWDRHRHLRHFAAFRRGSRLLRHKRT